VVSEETGSISLAFEGRIYYDLSPIEVTRKLREVMDRGGKKILSGDTGSPEIPEAGRGIDAGVGIDSGGRDINSGAKG